MPLSPSYQPRSRITALSPLSGVPSSSMRAARCLTLLAAFAACASAQTPLPLPLEPTETCTAGNLRQVTGAEPSCAATIATGKAATAECCQAIYNGYGANSTLPTRNCFCVPDYWTDLSAKQTLGRVRLSSYLDSCKALGYPIYYYQAGAGPCSGVSAAPSSGGGAAAGGRTGGGKYKGTPLPKRSFGQWLRDLDDDGLLLVSFMVAVVAAVGGALMFWSFVYDLYASLSSKARKQM